MNVLVKLVLFGGGAAIAAACTAEAYAQLVHSPTSVVSLPPTRLFAEARLPGQHADPTHAAIDFAVHP